MMKFLFVLLIVFSFVNVSAMPYDQYKILDVDCQATSSTGSTKFHYDDQKNDARSLTDTLFGSGIEDHYYRPTFIVFSKTGDQDPLKYGNAGVSFTFKPNSSSSKNYTSIEFIFNDSIEEGVKVYNIKMLGTNIMGFPSVGKTLYKYIGQGSCEINLAKIIN
jgi:hypothetical protein